MNDGTVKRAPPRPERRQRFDPGAIFDGRGGNGRAALPDGGCPDGIPGGARVARGLPGSRRAGVPDVACRGEPRMMQARCQGHLERPYDARRKQIDVLFAGEGIAAGNAMALPFQACAAIAGDLTDGS